MPIKVIDTIEPKTPNFKVVDASNVSYKGNSLEEQLESYPTVITETIENYMKEHPSVDEDATKKIVADYIVDNKDLLKGDKGDMMYSFEVDESGNLYCLYQEGTSVPNFEYDEANGNLYIIID